MNSWPGPENSWEGVDAYFTSADSEGTLIFWTLVVIAILIFVTWSGARHESDTSKNTKKLSKLVGNKIGTFTPNINLKTLNLIDTKSSSFKEIDGLMIGTIENFGYMSGLTKDFFDRCYDELKDKTEGLPIIYYVRAGLDGEGCKVALNKILIGLRWRQVLPPLILKGSWQKDYLKQLEKFVLTFTSGIELGIY